MTVPSTRYRLARLGLVHIWEYTNDVFEFAGGRLVLRGHNGAGKSKALELAIPFLFDGDTSPHKLDSFGGDAKRMRDNLLWSWKDESGRTQEFTQRTGYCWLELEIDGPDGGVPDGPGRSLTIGAGLSASKERADVRTRFFVIDGRRIGRDVDLVEGAEPVSFKSLADRLGEGAELFETAADYRARLNELLFGFDTMERYDTMVRLLLALRRPNLSDGMTPERVSELLQTTLPPIDRALVQEIGGLLDEIDEIRGQQAELESARESVAEFERDYTAYAKATVAQRAAALRRAHEGGRSAAGRAKRAERALEAGRERNGQLAARRGELEGELGRADAALGELRRTEAARTVEEIELREDAQRRAERAAAQLGEQLAAATADLERIDLERGEHAARLEQARRALEQAGQDADREARAAGVAEHAALASELRGTGSEPRALRARARAAAAQRREAVIAQRVRLVDVDEAAAAHRERVSARDTASERLRERQETRGAIESALVDARAAHAGAVERWSETLIELMLTEHEREQLVERAGATAEGAAPDGPRPFVVERMERQRRSLVERQHDLARDTERLAACRDELAGERDALRAAAHAEPPSVYTRAGAGREGRAGAPLWQLVDFAPELPDEQRAGIEGALEGAGLLDGWVTPDGRVLDALQGDASGDTPRGDGEVVLVAAAGCGLRARTLDGALVPEEGTAVPAAVVRGILRAVELADEPGAVAELDGADKSTATDVRDGTCAVAGDGRFAFGPARGRFAKTAAQFIGSAARERHRAERLAALEAEDAASEHQLDEIAAARQEVERREATLEAELATFPSDEEVRGALRNLTLASARERDARDGLDAAQRQLDAAVAALDSARRTAAAAALADGLPAPDERAALDAVDEAVTEYRVAAEGLVRAAESARDVSRAGAAIDARAAGAAERGRSLAADVDRSAAEARELAGELEAMRTTLGADARAILERLQATERRVAELKQERREVEQHAGTALQEVARAEVEAQAAAAAQREAGEALEAAAAGFRALAAADYFRLALSERAWEDAGDAASWTRGRALEAAADAAAALAGAGSPQELGSRVTDGYADLRLRLNSHPGVSVFLDRGSDELPLIGAQCGGRERTFVQLVQWIDAEIARNRTWLDEQEQDVLARALAGDIAEHLHERIQAAHQWVGEAKQATASCRTSSGMAVRLGWHECEDEHPGTRRALKLLRRRPEVLPDAERDELIAFLRERIGQARDSREAGTPTLDLLVAALDYRAWHEFRLRLVGPDGREEAFTKQRKGKGSGGEREVVLHLPLLAAAAALYNSGLPHAPRLIALDEAFNKVDQTGERGLLEVIASLDLDFMLTGHNLWCTHPELPEVAIYELKRYEGMFGVHPLARWRWEGGRKLALDGETGEQLEADPADARLAA